MERREPTAAELDGAVLIQDPKKRRKCPMCQLDVHLYYIDEEQLFLMCENHYCDFPFGYEPLQIVYNESQLVDNPPRCTPDFYEYPVGGIGEAQTVPLESLSSSITDNDEISFNRKDTNLLVKKMYPPAKLKKKTQELKKEKEMLNHLNNIKLMNKELKEIDEEDKNISKVIKNEKWLKTLNTWEMTSGTQLLSEVEKGLLKKTEAKIGMGELKIFVNPQNAIPSVNIEILEKSMKSVKKKCIS